MRKYSSPIDCEEYFEALQAQRALEHIDENAGCAFDNVIKEIIESRFDMSIDWHARFLEELHKHL